MSNFNNVEPGQLIDSWRRIGTVIGTAKAMRVGHDKVRLALKGAGIAIPPRGSLQKLVWQTSRKGEISKRRIGPTFVSYRIVRRWKGNADMRGLTFELTDADMQAQWDKQRGLCFFTGLPMVSPNSDSQLKAARRNPCLVSLDRLDSSRSYTPDNVAYVCLWVNLAKSTFSEVEFRAILEKAADAIVLRRTT